MSQQNLESLDVEAIREEFPILQREFDDQQVVYLDNAATTQTPDPVVDAMSDYYRESNANVHRGIHHLSQGLDSLRGGPRPRGRLHRRERRPRGSNFHEARDRAENLVAYSGA